MSATDEEFIRKVAAEVYGETDIDFWMDAPNDQLDNRAPQDWIDEGKGGRVIELLLRLLQRPFAGP